MIKNVYNKQDQKFWSDVKTENATFLFAEDLYCGSGKTSKTFSFCQNAEIFYDYTKGIKPEEKAFYEVVNTDITPNKLYADLEWPLDWKSEDEIKVHFLSLLEKYIPRIKYATFNKNAVHFLSASSQIKKKGSLHVITDYYLKDIHCHQNFWNLIKEEVYKDTNSDFLFIDTSDHTYNKKSYIDFAVYSKNRQFRLVQNAKMDKNGKLQRPLYSEEKINSFSDWAKYVISYYNENCKVYDTITDTTMSSNDNVGKREYQYHKNVIIAEADKLGVSIKGAKGSMIILHNKGARNCIISGTIHENNNCFFTLELDGIYFHCHSDMCKDKKIKVFDKFRKCQKIQKLKDVTNGITEEKIVFDDDLEDEIPFQKWSKLLRDNSPNDKRPTEAYWKAYKEVLNDMNNYFIQIQGTRPFYLYRYVEKDKTKTIYYKNMLQTHLFEAFNNQYGSVYFKGGLNELPLVKYLWMNSPHKRVYNSIDALPLGEEKYHTFNLFQGLRITDEIAKEIGDYKEGERVGEFIKKTWCDKDDTVFKYVICWLAHLIQKPFVKMNKCLVLMGQEGTGKSCIVSLLRDIIGEQWYLHPTNLEDIFGSFNYKLRNKTLIFADEVGVDRKSEATIKKLITEAELTTNEKHMSQITTTNRMNFIFASNEDMPITAGENARRFVVLKLGNDMLKMSDEEKEQIYKCNPASFARYLYSIDISNFKPETQVLTKQLLEQKELSASQPIQWMIAGVKDELEFPFDTEMEKSHFYNFFKNVYPNSKMGNSLFWKQVKKVLGSHYEFKKQSQRKIRIPKREKMTEHLEVFFGQKMEMSD
jgi:hypothetical protein